MPHSQNQQISRRDILLKEMGILEWKLVKASVLKGTVNILIDNNIKLVIIAEEKLEKSHPFIQDILRSLNINEEHCFIVDFDFLPYLHIKAQPNILCFIDDSACVTQIEEYLPDNLIEWRTSSMKVLQQSAQKKRQLWQQIQK